MRRPLLLLLCLTLSLASCKRKPGSAQPPVPPAPGDAGAGCPAEMVRTPVGACIDRWEASAGPAGSLGAPDGGGTDLVAVSAPGRTPITNVSQRQAAQACANAGKRLCTEAEWKSACLGRIKTEQGGTSYPYGPTYEGRRCNDWHASDQGKRGVAPTGSFARCVTPTGIYDMANNVAEWVSTREGGPYEAYAVRGGTYLLTSADSACEADDFTLDPYARLPVVGFRCCR